MKIYVVFPAISIILEVVTTESSEMSKVADKSTLKPQAKEEVTTPSASRSWDSDSINSFWVYRPVSHISGDGGGEASAVRRAVLRPPHALMRLVKTLSYGLNPQMFKEEITPFEKRRKPITLVGIRKNGNFPKKIITMSSQSAETAELQSPYNDIGQFWLDNPGNPRPLR